MKQLYLNVFGFIAAVDSIAVESRDISISGFQLISGRGEGQRGAVRPARTVEEGYRVFE